MASKSMMRLISNLLLQLALFVQARFAQLLSSIVELRNKAWQQMQRPAMPGSERRKIDCSGRLAGVIIRADGAL